MAAADSSPDAVLNVSTVGDAGVGKTSLVHRFVHNSFDSVYKATVVADAAIRDVDLDGKPVRAQIFDTAGQERFHSLVAAYLRKRDAIVLVYDLTSPETLNALILSWLPLVLRHCGPNTQFAVLGNKADHEDAHKTDADFEARHIKAIEEMLEGRPGRLVRARTSAKTGAGVDEVMTELLRQALRQKVPATDDSVGPRLASIPEPSSSWFSRC